MNGTNVVTFFKKYHGNYIDDGTVKEAFEKSNDFKNSHGLPFKPIKPMEKIIELYIRLFFSQREKYSLLMEAVKKE